MTTQGQPEVWTRRIRPAGQPNGAEEREGTARNPPPVVDHAQNDMGRRLWGTCVGLLRHGPSSRDALINALLAVGLDADGAAEAVATWLGADMISEDDGSIRLGQMGEAWIHRLPTPEASGGRGEDNAGRMRMAAGGCTRRMTAAGG